MAPVQTDEVLRSMSATKQRLVDFSTGLAQSGKWDEARTAIEWAKQIDQMAAALSRPNGSALVNRAPAYPVPATARPENLPRFYVEGDRLVKIGASRDGGTYEHRLTRANFDLVVAELRNLAGSVVEFETQRLVDRCNIPKHEPLIVVAVLERCGLLTRLRRGRWQFADPRVFAQRVLGVWQQLPRN